MMAPSDVACAWYRVSLVNMTCRGTRMKPPPTPSRPPSRPATRPRTKKVAASLPPVVGGGGGGRRLALLDGHDQLAEEGLDVGDEADRLPRPAVGQLGDDRRIDVHANRAH